MGELSIVEVDADVAACGWRRKEHQVAGGQVAPLHGHPGQCLLSRRSRKPNIEGAGVNLLYESRTVDSPDGRSA